MYPVLKSSVVDRRIYLTFFLHTRIAQYLDLALTAELKHFFERFTENVGDSERNLERRRVLTRFDGIDGLSGDADLIGELLLRHCTLMKPQLPDSITYSRA